MITKTYYDIIGLPNTATQDDIKKRYRELARRYHPDVARVADAVSKFREINEANSILSDPVKRATYDAQLKLAKMRSETAQKDEKERPQRNSAGYANDNYRQSANASAQSGSQRGRPAGRPGGAHAVFLVAEAMKAFNRLQYREAEMRCRQALRLDRRNAQAYEILGDIHRTRNHVDEAIAMYSYALQLDKRNPGLQAKFERLTQTRDTSATRKASAAYSRNSVRKTPPRGNASPTPKPAINLLGLALFLFIFYNTLSFRGKPAVGAVYILWDPLLLFFLLSGGILAGFLMAINGWVQYSRDDLFSTGLSRSSRLTAPLGVLLIGFAAVNYWLAFAVYLLVGFMQETISRSILRTFIVGSVLVILFALSLGIYDLTDGLWEVVSGGSLIFIGEAIGWACGDMFRQ